MKFYKRDPDRALAGMAALNSQQRGIYNSIIDLLYSRDNLVPCQTEDDDRQIAKYITVDIREWRHIKRQLMELGKIRITNDGLLNANRVEIELRSATDRSQIARRSATHRWDLYRLAKQFNGAAMRERNAKRVRVKNTSTNLEAVGVGESGDNGDNDESFGVVSTDKSIATGELAAVVRAKGWK